MSTEDRVTLVNILESLPSEQIAQFQIQARTVTGPDADKSKKPDNIMVMHIEVLV